MSGCPHADLFGETLRFVCRDCSEVIEYRRDLWSEEAREGWLWLMRSEAGRARLEKVAYGSVEMACEEEMILEAADLLAVLWGLPTATEAGEAYGRRKEYPPCR